MRREKYILPLFCAILLLSACEKDVKFKGDGLAPKLIVNSIVGSNSETHSLEVSESVFLFGDKDRQKVNDGTFGIRLNGEELTMTYSASEDKSLYYSFPAQLSPGDELEVWGTSVSHGNISGKDKVPFPVEITDLKTEWFTGEKDDKSYLRTLISFADKPSEKNYYRIVVKTMSILEGQDAESSGWNLQKVYVDQEILFNNIGGGMLVGDEDLANSYRIFSDESIDGTEYTLNVYVQLDRGIIGDGWGGTAKIAEQRVKVEIHSLSENLFKYMRSLELAMAENNFSEPVKIYSNITNGYGILGTYNVVGKALKIPAE